MPVPTPRRVLQTLALLLLAAASLAWPATARQELRYVAIDGNDTGPGTVAAPWRTIGRCVADARPGDTCLIGPGTFVETVRITRSGGEGNPIRITGREDGSTVVLGSVAIPGDYVELSHLRIDMSDGTTTGLAFSGRFGIADAVSVSTTSQSLGLNNVAVQLSGTGHVLRRSRLERTCFGVILAGEQHAVTENEVTKLRLTGVRCGDVDYVRLFGSRHYLAHNLLHGIDRSETGAAHIDCFQTFDNNGRDRAITDIVIEGNICRDGSQGLMFEARHYGASRGVIVRNNVFSRLGAWCANVNDIADVRFINNTCDTSDSLHGLWCRGRQGIGTCEFKNNILYGRGTAYGAFETARLIDGDSESPGKGNLVFRPDRAITGYASDIINQDPRFVDRLSGNYQLLHNSPARDSGVVINDWTTPLDRDGVPRPQGAAWDIGAYEFLDGKLAPPSGLRLLAP